MGYAEGVGTAMMTICGVVLVCVLGAIPLFTVVNAWLVEKSLDAMVAVAMICAVGLSIMGMIALWSSPLKFVMLAVLLGLNFLLPALGKAAGKVAEKKMNTEDIDKFLRATLRDARNAAAWAYLGEAYMRVRRYSDAIPAFEKAVELDPNHMQREKTQLAKARELLSGAPEAMEMCPGCYVEHPTGLIKCPSCGHYMKAAYFLQDVSRQAAPAGAILLGGTVVGSVLPNPLNGLVAIVALVAAGIYFFLHLKST